MSLINDALKRASQMDRGAGLPSGAASGIPPAPAERSSLFPIVLGVVVAVLAATGVWVFCWVTAVNHEAAPVLSVPMIASAPPSREEIAAPEKIEPLAVQAPSAKVEVKAVIPVTNQPPAFPRLKLEAIFFARTNPRALINGVTGEEGDEVAGMRVKRIEADKVTVEWNGQSKVIEMRGP
jgi:hypothetical protein